MPQTNTDNFDELIASCFEHSRTDSMDPAMNQPFDSDGEDSCCTSSCNSDDFEMCMITEVKVITENVDPAFLQESEFERSEVKDTDDLSKVEELGQAEVNHEYDIGERPPSSSVHEGEAVPSDIYAGHEYEVDDRDLTLYFYQSEDSPKPSKRGGSVKSVSEICDKHVQQREGSNGCEGQKEYESSVKENREGTRCGEGTKSWKGIKNGEGTNSGESIKNGKGTQNKEGIKYGNGTERGEGLGQVVGMPTIVFCCDL